MIEWINPNDPLDQRNRLMGPMLPSPELLEVLTKLAAQREERHRKRGPKKSTAIFTTADEFKEELMKALIQMKGGDQEWSVTNLARTYGIARSTLYDTADRLQVDVPAFIEDFLASQINID
jgi:transcriptional regulator of acetoin/glycerol metabolism